MKRAAVRLSLALALVLGATTFPGSQVEAIYDLCFGCGSVVIPDPTGGPGWPDQTCLADFGTAPLCIEVRGTGGRCLLVNEGDCN